MNKRRGFILAEYERLRSRRRTKGFTLIELLIVVVVIGILAGMVFVVIGGIEANARDRVRESDMRAIFTAMERQRREVIVGGGYMAITAEPATPVPGHKLTTIAIGDFLNPIPKDPLNTGDFIYRAWPSAVNSREFCIWARLEGGGFIAVSEKGPRSMATAPISLPACP
ncbi:MAG: Type II secretion system protein G [candidate division WS2 bacterium]|uniref:Type II secretion system protein G n=1 Tax=Psychracetigena formicireducens TaxID=2986056 RepID=A0A9E2F264_PSYF1|nr:Type II secretion system protein G [Candidatus Psychracetigena formicireducens]